MPADRAAILEAYNASNEAGRSGDRETAKVKAGAAFLLASDTFSPGDEAFLAVAMNYALWTDNDEEADLVQDRVMSILAQKRGYRGARTLETIVGLTPMLIEHGTLKAAKEKYRQELTEAKMEHLVPATELAGAKIAYGKLSYATLYFKEAQKAFHQSIEVLAPTTDSEARKLLAEAYLWRAKALFERGKVKRAIEDLERSLAILDELAPSGDNMMETRRMLVIAFETTGQSGKATEHCLWIGAAGGIPNMREYGPIYQVPPGYPSQALDAGAQGEVVVSMTVDEQGFVKDPEVKTLTGSRLLIAPSLRAARKQRFAPRFENGKAVPTAQVESEFTYEIAR